MNDAAALSALEVVDALEEIVASSRRIPLSANVMVNEDELLELVDRIRLALPEDLVQARHMVEDRARILGAAEQEAEQVLGRAEEEATRLVREAGERAAAMLSEHELSRQAQAHAAAVVAEAEQRAAATRQEADAYARDVMGRLEEQLARALATVRKGMETLPQPPAAGRPRRRPRS